MTVPFTASAKSSASADLPLAVGPAISTAFRLFRPEFMSLVATLSCNPAQASLDSTVLEAVRAILPNSSLGDWLDAGIAADIPFESDEPVRAIADRQREALQRIPVDVVVQPRIARRKKLLLADMDSTMIGQECIDELAAFAGLKDHVAAITE